MTFTVSITTVALILSAIAVITIGSWAYMISAGETYVKRSDFFWMTGYAAVLLVLVNLLFFVVDCEYDQPEEQNTEVVQAAEPNDAGQITR